MYGSLVNLGSLQTYLLVGRDQASTNPGLILTVPTLLYGAPLMSPPRTIEECNYLLTYLLNQYIVTYLLSYIIYTV